MKYCGTEDAEDIYVELILPRGRVKNGTISWRTLVPKNPVDLLMERILQIKSYRQKSKCILSKRVSYMLF